MRALCELKTGGSCHPEPLGSVAISSNASRHDSPSVPISRQTKVQDNPVTEDFNQGVMKTEDQYALTVENQDIPQPNVPKSRP